MRVFTLGARTDLMLTRLRGEVLDRGDHLVVRTPGNPTYHWGNYVMFGRPPARGDVARWTAAFDDAFPGVRESSHLLFAWETETPDVGDPSEFLARGMALETSAILTADRLRDIDGLNAAVQVRALRHDAEWTAAIELQVESRDPVYGESAYRAFKTAQFADYRRMSAAGRGNWYGAFLDGRMVGDLGLFHQDGLGRFQAVGTHPEFRRRGICRTLVHTVARDGLDRLGLRTLVIEAEADSAAGRVYAAVGFTETERRHALYRRTAPRTPTP